MSTQTQTHALGNVEPKLHYTRSLHHTLKAASLVPVERSQAGCLSEEDVPETTTVSMQ